MTETPLAIFEGFFDTAWLAKRKEAVIDRARPIIDPHHHIWIDPRPHYPVEELMADLAAGHNVRATVYLESRAQWRDDGPEVLRSVGETEWVADIADAHSRTDGPNIAAGIVGHAALELGDAVQEVLDAHLAAGRGRFKGVRANLFWDADFDMGYPMSPEDLAATPSFRAGFARLEPAGLVCDVMAFYTNLPRVGDLADAFPETKIVINHCGGPIGAKPYQDRRAEMFEGWRRNVHALAERPNLHMKIGGIGGPFFGPLISLRLRDKPEPPSSLELAEILKPYVEECITAFGADRCMFESNFPADKYDYDYVVIWNAFKRLTKDCSEDEKNDLFAGTAARFYSIDI